ncbi:winged helix-turn-helix transcriptional regulator [Pseudoalteromonas xiamenensis]|uniref:Helix-turn-helix transcriptional regulator n=1 Tax=Pseudoalteromonas xiamenensis TaxID=882626 RepID=A0A975DKY5_9GAMM|nr:helix-turn-helix domain-containing protein [Pseudoalteromonas xiamenensis]QTH72276.1 helix-turn-helix transcriptional regulator [Pseudoalteromonas xiamenensis]
MTRRSDCPISNVLDLVGDKWSLLILRDLLFFNKKSYSDLQNSDEKVASNILSNRLEKLEQEGLIAKQQDEKDKRKKIYTLTEKGVDMLPILLDMILWSAKYSPDTNIPVTLVNRARDDRDGLLEELRNRVAF